MSERDKRIYTFNMIAEAKARTLVIMTRKYHPDWTLEQIEDYIKRLLGYAVQKQAEEDALNMLVADRCKDET